MQFFLFESSSKIRIFYAFVVFAYYLINFVNKYDEIVLLGSSALPFVALFGPTKSMFCPNFFKMYLCFTQDLGNNPKGCLTLLKQNMKQNVSFHSISYPASLDIETKRKYETEQWTCHANILITIKAWV